MSRPSPRARRPKAAARDSGPSRDLERKQQLLQPGPPFPSPAAPPHAFASPGQPLLPRGPGRPPGCGGPVRAGRQERYSEANGYGNWLPRQSRCPTLQPPPVSHGSPGLQRGKQRFGGRGTGPLWGDGGGSAGVATAQRSPEGAVAAQTRVWHARALLAFLPKVSPLARETDTDRLHIIC